MSRKEASFKKLSGLSISWGCSASLGDPIGEEPRLLVVSASRWAEGVEGVDSLSTCRSSVGVCGEGEVDLDSREGRARLSLTRVSGECWVAIWRARSLLCVSPLPSKGASLEIGLEGEISPEVITEASWVWES